MCEPTFRRNVSPPSSGYKNPRARNQVAAATCSRWFLARGFLYTEVGGEMSVGTRSTRRHIPEDGILHSHRRENLKS
jgi:hypothetical protein